MRIELSYGTGPKGRGERELFLQSLAGRAEFSLRGTASQQAVDLLDNWMDFPSGLRARDLPLPAREELLFQLYRILYGDRIVNSLRCAGCEEPYDLTFSVSGLLQGSLAPSSAEFYPAPDLQLAPKSLLPANERPGWYQWEGGPLFRLPDGHDEPLLARLGEAALLRCLTEPDVEGETDFVGGEVETAKTGELARAIGALSPILDIELSAPCPECLRDHAIPFSMQHYLLQSLVQERPLLLQEIHHLASTYGWSLESILDLPRADRKKLAGLAVEEKSREQLW